MKLLGWWVLFICFQMLPGVAAAGKKDQSPPQSAQSECGVILSNQPTLVQPWNSLLRNKVLKRIDGFYRQAVLNPAEGRHISAQFLRELGVRLVVNGVHQDSEDPAEFDKVLSRIPDSGSLVVVANHVFGGLDGLILMSLLSERRDDVRIIMNEAFVTIPELKTSIIPVSFKSKTSKMKKSSYKQALDHLKNGGALIVFPGSEVARAGLKNVTATEGLWKNTAARLIKATKARVLPVNFDSQNSWTFQFFAWLNKKIYDGFKVNLHLEETLIPREILKKRDARIQIKMGNGVEYEKIFSSEVNGKSEVSLITRRLQTLTRVLGGEKHLLVKPLLQMAKEQLGNRMRSLAGPPGPFPNQPLEPSMSANGVGLVFDDVPGEIIDDIVERGLSTGSIELLTERQNLQVLAVHGSEIDSRLMRKIGIGRTHAFARVGEGNGDVDIDSFDEDYFQIIAWDKKNLRLAGGYRMGLVDEIVAEKGLAGLYSHQQFRYQTEFFEKVGLKTAEMGRTFVAEGYNGRSPALFLLWRGIAEFLYRRPEYRNLIGPLSMSESYSDLGIYLMIQFLLAHVADSPEITQTVSPAHPYEAPEFLNTEDAGNLLATLKDLSDLDRLVAVVEQGKPLEFQRIPPLMYSYIQQLGARVIHLDRDEEFHTVDALIRVHMPDVDLDVLATFLNKDMERARQLKEWYGQ